MSASSASGETAIVSSEKLKIATPQLTLDGALDITDANAADCVNTGNIVDGTIVGADISKIMTTIPCQQLEICEPKMNVNFIPVGIQSEGY